MFFWRTAARSGVDLISEIQGKLSLIGVKLSATPPPAMASAIAGFNKDFADRVMPGYVVHPGDRQLTLKKH